MRAIRATALPLATGIVLLALIEALFHAGLLPVFIPGPSQVLGEAWRNPALISQNVPQTARTAAIGYSVAAIVTLAAAGIGAVLRPLRSPIYSLGITLNAVPVIAAAPLLALWLGTGPSTQVVIAAFSTQFPLLVGAMQGLSTADARHREMLHALSASPMQVLWYLRMPAALPFLFAGFKVAAPLAVLGTVTAEWAGADRGVGAMMLYALFSYDIVKVWLSVLLCTLMAAGAYGAWALAERLVVTWDRGVENLP